MNEKKTSLLLVVVVCLAALLLVFNERIESDQLQSELQTVREDLAREQEFSSEVFSENQRLRDVNGRLRLRVVELTQNLSATESQVAACLEELPGLSNISAPQKRVDLSDVLVREDLVVIEKGDLRHGVIAPSKSMWPLLSENTLVLEEEPTGPEQIYVGDIIIFEHDGQRIIHRVVRMGWDNQGWFAITKGDNNPSEDPYKVRFDTVRGVVVGIIY